MEMLPELVDAWAQQHAQGLRIFSTTLDCHLQPVNSSWVHNVLAPHPEEEVPRPGGQEKLSFPQVLFFLKFIEL